MTRFMFYPILLCYITLSVLGNVEYFHGAVKLLLAIEGQAEQIAAETGEQVEELPAPDEWEPVASYPLCSVRYTENSQLASVVTAHSR